MTARQVTWLLVAGAAVIGFAIWLSSLRHLERATLAGDLVLPGFARGVNTVTEVSLRRGDETHATLSRQADQWLVAERGWPAERGMVRKLLLELGALQVVEEKTRLPANYAALGVEDVSSPKAAGTRIAVRLAGCQVGLDHRQALQRQIRLRAVWPIARRACSPARRSPSAPTRRAGSSAPSSTLLPSAFAKSRNTLRRARPSPSRAPTPSRTTSASHPSPRDAS